MKDATLVLAMIESCRETVRSHADLGLDQPQPLRPAHLVWMCDRMTENIGNWDSARLNRWIGFIQCAMIANRMIELDEAKRMFDRVKTAFGGTDRDLTDHLDPESPFELEIGGQG